jgi:CMP-N,N'-diacetyllegionaminic acid synthase
MSILALIPARGGSKGVPRKNIRELCGKPLIAWSIEAAQKSKYIDRLVVSTEDEEIAEIARNYGAEVPFMRPPELSQDETSGMAPVLHALEQLPGYENILLLQPTSPLRTVKDIDGIIQLYNNNMAPSCVSVCEPSKHPQWMYQILKNGCLDSVIKKPLINRRQELSEIFALNGSLYLAQTEWFNRRNTFINEETLGYIMPTERSVDIDSPLDWKWAEFLLKESIIKVDSN